VSQAMSTRHRPAVPAAAGLRTASARIDLLIARAVAAFRQSGLSERRPLCLLSLGMVKLSGGAFPC
jgi:hypothetical protein